MVGEPVGVVVRAIRDPLQRYVAAVVALGWAALAVAWVVGSDAGFQLLAVLLFAAAFALVQLLPIPIPHGDQVESVRFEEAVVVPLVLALSPFDALVAVAVGIGAGHVASRAPLQRTMFNVAQMMISTGAALLVVVAVSGPMPGPEPVAMVAAVAGLVAMYVVNQLLFAGVMARAGAARARDLLTRDVRLRLLMWCTNAALGLMLVTPLFTQPWLLVVTLVPLVVMHGSYRAYVDRAREEQRLRDLHQYTSALGGDLMLDRVALCLVDSARRLAGAESAELQLHGQDDVYVSWGDWIGAMSVEEFATSGASGANGSGDAEAEFAIPVQGSSNLSGVLTVRCRRPVTGLPVPVLDDRDRTLLLMLVAQAETALDNALLYRKVNLQKRKLTQLFEHSNEGLMMLNASGRVVSWNPAMTALSGFSADEMTDSPIALISPQLGEIAAGIGSSDGPAVMTTADGARRQVHASYSPIPGDDDMHPELWVVVIRDVTRERETERLKDDFVATVSHELRTPLTAIKGFLDTMRRPDVDLPPEQVETFLEIMSGQTDRLERLISDLLDMSLIESGRPLKLHTAPTNLWLEVQRAVAVFQSARPDADLLLHVPMEPVFARVDTHRLQQVITNLLENAHKHASSDEPIEVACDVVDSKVQISIADCGRGILAHDIKFIFDRFYCASDSVTRSGGGAGLGLYICRKLIEAMEGTIAVDSTVGEGTTFTINLDLVQLQTGTRRPMSHLLLEAV